MHRLCLVEIIRSLQNSALALHQPWSKLSTYTGNTSHFIRLSTGELALGYKPQIAGRKYIPGSTSGGFPGFLPGPKDGDTFPMAYKVTKPLEFDITEWSSICRQLIDAELTVYGTILIRFNMIYSCDKHTTAMIRG